MKRTARALALVAATSLVVGPGVRVGAEAADPGPRATRIFTATKTVGMHDDYFSPTKVKVTAGSRVKWVNLGKSSHTTTGPGWGKTVSPGQSYARKFTAAGTFKYTCAFHPGMKGKVVVV